MKWNRRTLIAAGSIILIAVAVGNPARVGGQESEPVMGFIGSPTM